MGRAAKTQSLLQPSTAAADGGGEEVRWPLYWAAVNRLCLLSGSTINGNLERRRTSNQQSTSMAARESNKGRQSQRMWEHNNQPKDQLRRRISKCGGNAAAAKMTARAARVGAMRRQQWGIMATTAARTGVAWQQRWRRQGQQGPGQVRRGGNNSSESGGDTATTAARTIPRDT